MIRKLDPVPIDTRYSIPNPNNKPSVGLGGPFTTKVSTTIKTCYILSVSAQTKASYLGRSLRLACVPSDSKLQLVLERARSQLSCPKSWRRQAAIKLRVNLIKDRTSGFPSLWRLSLPSAGGEEQLSCAVFLDGFKKIMVNTRTKRKVKRKQCLSRPARGELKLSSSKMKKHFAKLHPYGSYCIKPVSVHNLMLQWNATWFGVSCPLNWEWRHCDPGRISWLKASRDQGKVLGAGRTLSYSFTPFGSWSCSFVLQLLVLIRPE